MTKKDLTLLTERYIKEVILNEKIEIVPQGKSPANADQYTVAIDGQDVARLAVFQGTVSVSVMMDANSILGTSFRFPIPKNKMLASLHGRQFKSLDQFQQAAEAIAKENKDPRYNPRPQLREVQSHPGHLLPPDEDDDGNKLPYTRFKYKGLNSSGKPIDGELSAHGKDEARARLRAFGYYITHLEPG